MTSTASVLEKLAITIVREWRNLRHNNDTFAGEEAINAQAPNWLREAPTCPNHPQEKMFRSLVKTPTYNVGDWMCHSCVDELRFARAEKERSAIPIINDANYHGGDVRRAINKAQEEYKQELIKRAAYQRVPTLPRNTGEISAIIPQANIPTLLPSHQNTHEIPLSAHVLQCLAAEGIIPQANVPTAPLAAQDIVYASTPDLDKTIPRLRAISRETKIIPAITAEIPLLEMMRRAPTHEQSTGEQERINEDAFLL